ncbi:zinc-binding protein [Herbaspirillum sp. HC18]|nr:zinc-binding protein [Herbaspirillum sp. HC18]
MPPKDPNFPLVYSCSGCSSAAQTANQVALQLDRRGVAEMSCIAGVGGDVPQLVRIAKSGRPIIGIDGCPLACVKSSLARHDVAPRWYYQLNDFGVKKRFHADFDPVQVDKLIDELSDSVHAGEPQEHS